MSQAPDNSQKSEETQTEDSTKPSTEQPRKSSKHYTIEELEEGLKIVGFGRYSLMRLLTLALLLISAVMEVIGSSIVLPAARCDFDISDNERGAVSAIPYIGILLTSYFHGYMIDTRGRRRMAIYTSLATGCLSFLSAFMPNLASYAFCKFLASLFVAVPSALPYTYIGEIVPKEHRDMLLSIANALQLVGSALVPIIAWIIIPMQFRFNFGLYYFRPWRLLIMIYALFLIITAYLLTFCPESPKYLLSRGYPEEALKVLQTIYAGNKKLPPEDFPMKSLSGPTPHKDLPILQCLKRQSRPFLKRKYMKYLMLNGFLLFGVFSIFNGLYVWILDVVNRVISEDNADRTACEVIMDSAMLEEVEQICIEDIETQTFMINSFAQLSCAIIGFVFSFTVVKFIGKFYLLLGCYLTIGTFCLFVNYITEPILFIMVISAFPLIALALGPIHAYNVHIYPPHMRGMAGLLCMMFGRVGSIFSSVLIGLLIDEHCEELFFTFTSLQYVCAALLYFHRPNKPKN